MFQIGKKYKSLIVQALSMDEFPKFDQLTEILKFHVMQRALPTTAFDPFNISVRK